MRISGWIGFAIVLLAAASALAQPALDTITQETILEHERFWPYQVALREDWAPLGADRPLRAGTIGVLVRIEAGSARIDFGRRGRHEVPVAATDVVARANAIHSGAEPKMAPNFLFAIGTKLVDSAADRLAPFRYQDAGEIRSVLCVFADPTTKEFAEHAASLEEISESKGLLTIFFPQGAHSDASVRDILRAQRWTVPFVYDHYSEGYTRSLSDALPPPAVLLQTPEGRVLFRSGWETDLTSRIAAALRADEQRERPLTSVSLRSTRSDRMR